jgi:hypothetical protein
MEAPLSPPLVSTPECCCGMFGHSSVFGWLMLRVVIGSTLGETVIGCVPLSALV